MRLLLAFILAQIARKIHCRAGAGTNSPCQRQLLRFWFCQVRRVLWYLISCLTVRKKSPPKNRRKFASESSTAARVLQPPISRSMRHSAPENRANILHLNGDDEEQQHLKIRVEHGKSKKQRQVDVVAGAVTCERSRQDGPEHAAQVIDVELEIAPGIFQCVADEIANKASAQGPAGWCSGEVTQR